MPGGLWTGEWMSSWTIPLSGTELSPWPQQELDKLCLKHWMDWDGSLPCQGRTCQYDTHTDDIPLHLQGKADLGAGLDQAGPGIARDNVELGVVQADTELGAQQGQTGLGVAQGDATSGWDRDLEVPANPKGRVSLECGDSHPEKEQGQPEAEGSQQEV